MTSSTYDLKAFWEIWGQTNALYTMWAAKNETNYYRLFVLYALDRAKSITQKEISRCTGLTKQTVNTVVRSLKADGYIVLSEAGIDRREKIISFTKKGSVYVAALLNPLYALESRAFDIMGSDRVKQMVDAIALFNTIFEKEMEK